LTSSLQHGLVGLASNNAKEKERQFFRQFVQDYRVPTGQCQGKKLKFWFISAFKRIRASEDSIASNTA
jgi:hypothetical protein